MVGTASSRRGHGHWVIRSTGSVPNPTGPSAAPVTRTIQTKVPVKIADPELPAPGVLEWLYSPTSATALQRGQDQVAVLHARATC